MEAGKFINLPLGLYITISIIEYASGTFYAKSNSEELDLGLKVRSPRSVVKGAVESIKEKLPKITKVSAGGGAGVGAGAGYSSNHHTSVSGGNHGLSYSREGGTSAGVGFGGALGGGIGVAAGGSSGTHSSGSSNQAQFHSGHTTGSFDGQIPSAGYSSNHHTSVSGGNHGLSYSREGGTSAGVGFGGALGGGIGVAAGGSSGIHSSGSSNQAQFHSGHTTGSFDGQIPSAGYSSNHHTSYSGGSHGLSYSREGGTSAGGSVSGAFGSGFALAAGGGSGIHSSGSSDQAKSDSGNITGSYDVQLPKIPLSFDASSETKSGHGSGGNHPELKLEHKGTEKSNTESSGSLGASLPKIPSVDVSSETKSEQGSENNNSNLDGQNKKVRRSNAHFSTSFGGSGHKGSVSGGVSHENKHGHRSGDNRFNLEFQNKKVEQSDKHLSTGAGLSHSSLFDNKFSLNKGSSIEFGKGGHVDGHVNSNHKIDKLLEKICNRLDGAWTQEYHEIESPKDPKMKIPCVCEAPE